jgi:hypothetical protein
MMDELASVSPQRQTVQLILIEGIVEDPQELAIWRRLRHSSKNINQKLQHQGVLTLHLHLPAIGERVRKVNLQRGFLVAPRRIANESLHSAP